MPTIPLSEGDFYVAYARARHLAPTDGIRSATKSGIDAIRALRSSKKLPPGVRALSARIEAALRLSVKRHDARANLDELTRPHTRLDEYTVLHGNLRDRYHQWVEALVYDAWSATLSTYSVRGGWAKLRVKIPTRGDHTVPSRCIGAESAAELCDCHGQHLSVRPVKVKGGYNRWSKNGERTLTLFRSWRKRVHAEGIATVDKHFVLDATPVPPDWLDALSVNHRKELDRYADRLYEAAWVVKRAGYSIGIQYGIILCVGGHRELLPYPESNTGREYRKRRDRVLTQAARRSVALRYDAQRGDV